MTKYENIYDYLYEKTQGFNPIKITEQTYFILKKNSENLFPFFYSHNWVYELKVSRRINEPDPIYQVYPICTYIEIIKGLHNISTDERYYLIKAFNRQNVITFQVDSSVLTSQGVTQLLNHGSVFTESNKRSVLSYLSTCATLAPIENIHSKLGWYEKDGTYIFLSYKAISNTDFESTYRGNLSLEPKGSLDTWLEMVKKEVIGNIPLTTGMLFGFSGILLGYLNNFHAIGNLFFNFAGNSSKGKTTVAMLATSVFSKPIFDQGLITTYNSTSNALLTFVSNANSHTVTIDEVGTADGKDFRKILYQLCSGSERKRLDSSGEQKECKTFSSVIISTAELQLVDNKTPDGLKARVFELDDNLTKDAQNSDNIKNVIYENYGVAGEKFAKFIIDNKLEHIEEDYLRITKDLQDNYLELTHVLQKHPLADRILSKLAVVLEAALYFSECFEIDCDYDAIKVHVANMCVTVGKEISIDEAALDYVMQYVERRRNMFTTDFHADMTAVEGRIEESGSTTRILIMKEIVDDILEKKGFENPKLIYKKWAEKKIIEAEKDRNYKRLSIISGHKAVPCFYFKLKS